MAQQGNCFLFNSEYNFDDAIMYNKLDEEYHDTKDRRTSTLAGLSFGLHLIIDLDQLNYMEGEIAKQVCQFFPPYKLLGTKKRLHVK